jgi:hypothetical protein
MASVVDICNEAMDLLGAATITSLDENSKEARLCKRFFDLVRDTMLRDHPWNWAITRKQLAQDSETPPFGFTAQFSLPTDPFCLKVLSLHDDAVDSDIAAYDSTVMFKIEGRKILTNENSCQIIYIGRITDTEQYDSSFRYALATGIAANSAYAITGSNSLMQQMQAMHLRAMADARSLDAKEGFPEQLIANEFVNARF